MGKKINIGILGCANIARRSVIPAIKQLRDKFEIKHIASRSYSKAEKFTKEFGGIPIEDYDNLIKRNDIDALYIPLPTGLHKEFVNKALVSGKHVYVEKSIAMCHADALEMVNNARERNLAIMEGYMFQYHSQHDIVKELINNKLGEARFMIANFCFPPLPRENFRYSPHIGGGVLTDAAGYPLRAVHFLFGSSMEIKSAALSYSQEYDTHIYGSAFLSNNKGLGAAISFGFDNFYQCNYEILGQKAKITAKRAYTPSPGFSPEIILETPDGEKHINAQPDNHFLNAMQEFYYSIKGSHKRKQQYSDILLQSKSLEMIQKLSE